MRVLILSAFLAYAAAAPSGVLSPLVYQAVAVPAAVPTISPGDIQAAAIDAQVKINDLARAAADKAQEQAEEAVSNVNEKVITDVDQIKERSLEAFWLNEDKKWQALDAIKTAEAQIDGAVASKADVFAKSSLAGAVPYVAAVGPVAGISAAVASVAGIPAAVAPVAPVVAAPIPPAVYTPYVAAVKSVSTQTVEVKADENKEEKNEALVKTAEPEKEAPAAENAEKTEAGAEKPADIQKPIILASSLVSPIANLYRYDVAVPAVGQLVAQPAVSQLVAQPAVSQLLAQPVVGIATSFQQINGVVAPTVVKHAW